MRLCKYMNRVEGSGVVLRMPSSKETLLLVTWVCMYSEQDLSVILIQIALLRRSSPL